MASKAVAVEYLDNGTIVVRVEHLDTDSFSRSVDRAAQAAWKKQPLARRAAALHTGGNYGLHLEGRRCYSLVGFGPDFATVYRAVGRPDLAEQASA